jgi:hypothetical protein
LSSQEAAQPMSPPTKPAAQTPANTLSVAALVKSLRLWTDTS